MAQQWRCVWALAWILAAVAALASPALAQGRGPVTLAIGSAAGGGYDQYARLTARYLQRELPDNPTVIAKNMTGAGGIVVLNWMYNSAPRDGTAIASTQGSSVFAPLQGMAGAQYDPREFNWLISLGDLKNILIVRTDSSVKTLADVFDKGMALGNVAGDSSIIPAMLNRLLGTRFKIITGYPGTNAVALAVERGEVDGTINLEWGSIKSTRANWLAEKKIRLLLQVTFTGVPELADVPTIVNYIKSDEDRDMLQILLAKQDIGRPFLAPPGMAPEVVAEQRRIFAKIAKDPEFIAEAEKMKLTIDPSPGEELAALVKRVYAISPSTIEHLHREMKLAESGIVER
ncbi:MAG TPA: tripartite tricarboxylate transporter substrate-binding protein [Alphaproteobacteria bacterium]|jgi:tripartite-type tricarboxylate transporter receptor subunit TctC|nr:tripartite tricarboxylate transporter substrate-binding protein [Alphaproteobacteria bacterium]